MRDMHFWTPERIEELLSLWRQGLTTYQMAAHFRVTRNSICGKLHREKVRRGLMQEKPHAARKVVNDGTVPKRRYTRREPMMTLPSSAGSVSAYVAPKLAVPDQGQLASIVDVTGCRWPVRDDAAFIGGVAFCNHQQKNGSSYCPYHASQNRAAYSREVIRRTIKSVLYLHVKGVAA